MVENRHGRFRASEAFRWVFDEVVRHCMAAGLVKGEGFAVDTSLIADDARHKYSVQAGEAILPLTGFLAKKMEAEPATSR
jgi:hypothetical protein